MPSKLDSIPTTWGAAARYLGGKAQRPCGNNTTVRRGGDLRGGDATDIALWLHSTPVVTYRLNGELVLDTGGWRTVTTKERLNRVLRPHGAAVASVKGTWYFWADRNEPPVPFYDGITFTPLGLA